jgi:hypothetical protein
MATAVAATMTIPEEWLDRSWKERVKALVAARGFESAREGEGFSFGIWRIFFLEDRVLFTTVDAALLVEVTLSANGWWRMLQDTREWVVWSQGARSPQKLARRTVQFLTEQPVAERKVLPIIPGTKRTFPPPSHQNPVMIEATQNHIVIRLPSWNHPNEIFLSRTHLQHSNYHGYQLTKIPTRT